MARAYAEVIRGLWGASFASVVPRQLKMTIGRYKDTFLGYQQQDSQELISFLLDGLHEDLNRFLFLPVGFGRALLCLG